jgi:serine/threonine-protein kinase
VPPAGEGERETAKVVDFGLAKLRDMALGPSLTQTGAVMGTPSYMSPEQCRGEEMDARADVYALGAMLYEMLAGRPPFRSDSLAGLITKHLHEEPPALPVGSGPPALEAACRRALAKNPDGRQPDANALSRELRTALDAPPAAAPHAPGAASGRVTPRSEAPTLPRPPAPREKKSHRLKFAAAGLVALLACALVAAVALRYVGGGGDDERVPRVTNSDDAGVSVSPTPQEDAGASTAAEVDGAPEEIVPGASPSTTGGRGLAGRWVGTYGPLGQQTTLDIKEGRGGKLSGVLEQGGARVAFTGSFDASSRKVTMKETRLLSGGEWSLGENTGEVSSDGRKMSGTGSDPVGAQLGITYTWSFSKQ